MIRYIIFSDHIDKESVELFLNNFSLIVKEFELTEIDDKKLIIYFSSSGGSVEYSNYMIDFINRHINKFKIELFISNIVYSSGFIVPFDFNGHVTVSEFCTGLIHKIDLSLNISDFNKINTVGQFMLNEVNISAEKDINKFWFLSEENKANFIEGKDIYLSNYELTYIFETQNLRKCV